MQVVKDQFLLCLSGESSSAAPLPISWHPPSLARPLKTFFHLCAPSWKCIGSNLKAPSQENAASCFVGLDVWGRHCRAAGNMSFLLFWIALFNFSMSHLSASMVYIQSKLCLYCPKIRISSFFVWNCGFELFGVRWGGMTLLLRWPFDLGV